MSINVEKETFEEQILDDVIRIMVSRCPELILFPKTDTGYQDITPVHLAILKEDIKLLKDMTESLKNRHEDQRLPDQRLPLESIQDICAVGLVFQNTVMMAGTPLGVAALKFNKDIFNIVLEHFASGLDAVNENRDNIVHSLIKYAHVQPDKLNDVLEMLRYVLQCKFIASDHPEKFKTRKSVRKLLMMKNRDKLNPMQLAVKKEQFQIFELIITNEVYITRESGDGMFNEEVYDITEIETLNIEEPVQETGEDKIKQEHHESILEYLLHQQTNNAFLFVDFMPIKEVIRAKWKAYKWWFWGWFALHLSLMCVLSVSAVYRSKLASPVTKSSAAVFAFVVNRNAFVTTASVIGSGFGVLYLAMEMSRIFISRFQFQTSSNTIKRVMRHFNRPYSNLIFRIYIVLFSFLLLVDCVVAAIQSSGSFSGYENYCLIFAIIIGWYLSMFFLQTIKGFSIFTVLIQRALIDMLKFALVMTFLLVAFSVAMYMIMQGADTDEDDFEQFSTTILKLLMIMLGIGELGVLFQARHPYLAIFVFILFVLLTTILLLNALIAMMSNSCTDLMNNYGGVVAAKLHCRLQKLSVILFLEGFIPRRFCKEVGMIKKKYRYENNKWAHNTNRRMWARSSVHDHEGTEKTSEPMHLINQAQEGVVSLIMKHLSNEILSRDNNVFPALASMTMISSLNRSLSNKQPIDINHVDNDICDNCKQTIIQGKPDDRMSEKN